MNVVPAVTADRAEAVLHDLAMIRARGPPAKGDGAVAVASADAPPPPVPAAEPPAPAPSARPTSSSPRATPRPPPPSSPRSRRSAPVKRASPGRRAPADRPRRRPSRPAGDAPPQVAALPAPDQPQADAPARPGPGPRQPRRATARRGQDLYKAGNYPAARQLADQAKAGKLGVDAQADDLLSQIALAEQGGALSMYESALDAVRKGEVARARALLTEVAAAGEGVDDGLRQKVQGLLDKLPADDAAGKASVTDRLAPADDAQTIDAQRLNAEVGTKIAEARRLQETDPEKAIAIYDQTLKAVKASGLPDAARPDDGPPPGSRHRAGQEGQGRLRRQDEGQEVPRGDRAEAAPHP